MNVYRRGTAVLAGELYVAAEGSKVPHFKLPPHPAEAMCRAVMRCHNADDCFIQFESNDVR